MNSRHLLKLGVPEDCINEAIAAVRKIVASGGERVHRTHVKQIIKAAVENPQAYVADQSLGAFAQSLVDEKTFVRLEPIAYRTWGSEGIEPDSHSQMRQACGVPVARRAAL